MAMRFGLVLVAFSLSLIQGSATQAQGYIDTQKAQSEMFARISATVGAYAKTINIADVWVLYCLTEANRKAEHRTDGSAPFGIDWSTIRDQKTLDLYIYLRENWYKQEQVLCLARAKNELREAAKDMGR
jgi:hypothetical protein